MNVPREQKMIHVLLVICMALGFACFAFIFLPDHLRRAGAEPSPSHQDAGSRSIADFAKLDEPEPYVAPAFRKDGPIARFVPESMPANPYSVTTGSRENPDAAFNDAPQGGAGAAMDQESTESLLGSHGEEDEGSWERQRELQARRRGRSAEEESPFLMRLPISSLARGDPSALDSDHGRRTKPWLITPAGFEADVAFWRDIYMKYDSNQVVLHHPRYLSIIYSVVELGKIERDPRLNDVERTYQRKQRVEAERERITEILKKLAKHPLASSLSDDEWQIRQLFSGIEGKDLFRKATEEDGVRAQLGQRDKFLEGLARSGSYLGEIESIFASYGLPQELTRLIFVESMFNPQARSSAGASGIWQFMPDTGKLFLNMNEFVDERNDFLKATHAAARLLRQNYEDLGSWPLAINAYNAGRGRLRQAIAQLGTDDIGRIMRTFSHPAYGFASRNFYLEFLAAYEVAEHAERYFGNIPYNSPLRFDVVTSDYHLSLPDVARIAHIPFEEIVELNPAFTNRIQSGKTLLPAGHEVRVPEGKGDLFLASAARAPGSKTGALFHVVRRGETLSSIARSYDVTPASIMKSNKHISRHVRLGQKIRIPYADF